MDLCKDNPKGWLKRTGEWLLGGAFGNWLDGRFMRLTMKRWQEEVSAGRTRRHLKWRCAAAGGI
ncbi:MAG: hypothetical protein U0176_10045 [Bacteroidia bacterium]